MRFITTAVRSWSIWKRIGDLAVKHRPGRRSTWTHPPLTPRHDFQSWRIFAAAGTKARPRTPPRT